MFDFNEELFLAACQKIEDSLFILSSKKDLIQELGHLSFKCEFQGRINGVCNKLNTIYDTVDTLKSNTEQTKKVLNITDDSDVSLLNNYQLSAEMISLLMGSDNLLDFLNSGQYGVDQKGPYSLLKKAATDPDSMSDIEKKQYQDLLSVLQKYGYLTESGTWNKSMSGFMRSAATGGCGFAANSNIIISIYSNMEHGNELFEKEYGFPLYYEDSTGNKYYNYNALFASHYLNSIDSFSSDVTMGLGNQEIPSPFSKWNPSLVSTVYSKGTVDSTRINALDNEFEDFHFDNTIYNGNVQELEKYSTEFEDHDYAIINANHFVLRDSNNKTININAGHYMLCTGVTEDGKYIVSSWGEEYILDKSTISGSLCFVDIGS